MRKAEMRESFNMAKAIARLTCLALLILLCGCGYQFRVDGAGPTIGGATEPSSSTSPPPRLVVRTLENRSFEPNLETRYTNYLRHEFSSGSGAQIVPEAEAADLVLSGQILSVSVPTLSFSQTTTLESRTEVVVTVKVEETRTKRLVWAQMSKGTSEFFITPDLQFNRVLQNRALEQAGRFIAEDLASRFLLQLESGQLAKPPSASDNADSTIK
ncbi:MAG TPA: LPS assembly lipoprotein LptE [Nitrospiraceae bacterium]|nr:LPS assembly lipoprotein LptE [Nitrospiraceae bacterium]